MDEILTLLRRKLIELGCYKNLTNRLLHESIDIFPELIAARDEQLKGLVKTEKDIEKAILSGNRALSSVIKDGKESEDYPEVSLLCAQIRDAKAEIIALDKKAAARLHGEMDLTLEQIKGSEKSNKVASYIKSANYDVAKGAKLSAKS
ncbi:MAG: hypothetical protein LBL80_05030 [Ruminococcus sp.]|jgi:ADP-dependent phosphofructokinase/glucokinase|nr:hypothetical protein [Ruminococcus sp.]